MLKAMAHVEASGYIGWRQHDAVTFTIALWLKIMVFFPKLIGILFDGLWGVGFIHGVFVSH